MNDPRYLELTRSIIVDHYTPERRAQLAAQQEPDMNIGLSVSTILWIAAGIWATFVLLMLWGCTSTRETKAVSQEVCYRAVVGEHITDRCVMVKKD